MHNHLAHTYARFPITLVKGKGVWVWDQAGKKYLDWVAGIAVMNLGHSHPRIVKALKAQATNLIHTSNLYYTQEQSALARRLTQLSGLSAAFFCNSGTEAIEAAIKFARHYAVMKKGIKLPEIICFNNSFHGRTFGALTATGQAKYKKDIGSLLPGFKHVPFNDLPAVSRKISAKTAAVLVEPVQGEGGVILPQSGFIEGLSDVCRKRDLLLILDEVQTGMGRTGRFFAYQDEKIVPAIVALAKGLGSGFPIGATLIARHVADVIKPGLHASTFGGNPLAARVALETLAVMGKPHFMQNVRNNGNYFYMKLNNLKEKYHVIHDVRARGLMLAVELKEKRAKELALNLLAAGLLVSVVGEKTLRFIPPLVISKREIDFGLKLLEDQLSQ